MEATQDTLNILARRLRLGDWDARPSVRQELEERLVPLIRCALRTGTGVPALVDWVRGRQRDSAADGSEPLDPSQAAPRYARLLCAGLVRDVPFDAGHDTVRGR